MSTVKSAILQVSCALTKHKVSLKDEEDLFESSEMYLDTECEKCETPIRIRKDENNDRYYYVEELRYTQIEA